MNHRTITMIVRSSTLLVIALLASCLLGCNVSSRYMREQAPPQPIAGQAYLKTRSEDVQERLRRANDALRKYSHEDLAERTLRLCSALAFVNRAGGA